MEGCLEEGGSLGALLGAAWGLHHPSGAPHPFQQQPLPVISVGDPILVPLPKQEHPSCPVSPHQHSHTRLIYVLLVITRAASSEHQCQDPPFGEGKA